MRFTKDAAGSLRVRLWGDSLYLSEGSVFIYSKISHSDLKTRTNSIWSRIISLEVLALWSPQKAHGALYVVGKAKGWHNTDGPRKAWLKPSHKPPVEPLKAVLSSFMDAGSRQRHPGRCVLFVRLCENYQSLPDSFLWTLVSELGIERYNARATALRGKKPSNKKCRALVVTNTIITGVVY